MLEDKKFELNDEDLDNVAGGAFNYYDTDGNGDKDTCKIDGYGTYHCNAASKSNITLLILQNPGCSVQQIIDMAIEKKYLW